MLALFNFSYKILEISFLNEFCLFFVKILIGALKKTDIKTASIFFKHKSNYLGVRSRESGDS